MWRAVLAGVSVALATVCGVVTALVTAHPSRGLWVGLGVLIVAGAVSQAAVTYEEKRGRARVEASGDASVAVGGSASGTITTRVYGGQVQPTSPGRQEGTLARGAGAASVRGDANSISTFEAGNPDPGGGQSGKG